MEKCSSNLSLSANWSHESSLFILRMSDGGLVLLNETLFQGEGFEDTLIQQSMRQYMELQDANSISLQT